MTDKNTPITNFAERGVSNYITRQYEKSLDYRMQQVAARQARMAWITVGVIFILMCALCGS